MFAGIPIVTQIVNAVNKTKPARAMVETPMGIDRDAWMPSFADTKIPFGGQIEHDAAA